MPEEKIKWRDVPNRIVWRDEESLDKVLSAFTRKEVGVILCHSGIDLFLYGTMHRGSDGEFSVITNASTYVTFERRNVWGMCRAEKSVHIFIREGGSNDAASL